MDKPTFPKCIFPYFKCQISSILQPAAAAPGAKKLKKKKKKERETTRKQEKRREKNKERREKEKEKKASSGKRERERASEATGRRSSVVEVQCEAGKQAKRSERTSVSRSWRDDHNLFSSLVSWIPSYS